jgi:RNA-directed DNA polymerase
LVVFDRQYAMVRDNASLRLTRFRGQFRCSYVCIARCPQKMDQGPCPIIVIMEYSLTQNPEELVKKFRSLQTRKDVAELLEVDEKFLRIVLYGTKEREKYRNFETPKKSGGTRTISIPPKNLAILQSKLNTVLSLVYTPKWCAFGFVREKNIVGNANEHCRKRHVVNLDLENFFPSINIHRVKGSMSSYGVGYEAAVVIAQICCMADGTLPQGSPASPIISNIICRSLDNELMQFAKGLRCRYTRYADDITFSTSLPRIPSKLGHLAERFQPGSQIVRIIERHGFKINDSKIQYYGPAQRQEVTGLTVNEFPNIKRAFTRSVLGALYAWEKYGYENASAVYKEKYQKPGRGIELRNHLRGRLCFLRMVIGHDAPMYRRAVKRFNIVNPADPIPLPPLTEVNPYPLRGRSPNELWSLWFARYAPCICLLTVYNDENDENAATAFCISDDMLATAAHNLRYPRFVAYIGNDRLQEECCHIDDAANAPDIGLIRIKNCAPQHPFLPTQGRLPEIGEEVCAIGYPALPRRDTTLVMHTGVVEALPVAYSEGLRFIQVSFQSGGGLSGAPLIDRRGFVVGVMVGNIFTEPHGSVPQRAYGQAVPIEYLNDLLLRVGIAPTSPL